MASTGGSAPQGLARYKRYTREELGLLFEPELDDSTRRGRWSMPGIVETPRNSGNFALLVTLGKPSEGNPYRDELREDGYLLWESQTQQDFRSPSIQKFISHDPEHSRIHVFLRGQSKTDKGYVYMGLLEYHWSDPVKERPVHFIWRIRHWDLSPADLRAMQIPFEGPLFPAEVPAAAAPHLPELVQVAPPPPPAAPKKPGAARKPKALANEMDWATRDQRNRQLGLLGEKLVLRHEIEALKQSGHHQLAAQVQHVALVDGSAGFDILSFHPDGRPKKIEVKTTEGPRSAPFFISSNEVATSLAQPESYFVYRVFGYNANADTAQFYVLAGDVASSCKLEPTCYRAFPGAVIGQ